MLIEVDCITIQRVTLLYKGKPADYWTGASRTAQLCKCSCEIVNPDDLALAPSAFLFVVSGEARNVARAMAEMFATLDVEAT